MADLGPGECTVCRRWVPNLEEEHVMSDWWGKQVERYGPYVVAEYPEYPVMKRPGHFKLPICPRCNRRLGKTIEEPASKLLKSFAIHAPTHPVTLSGHEQKILARWIVKVCVMMQLIAISKGAKPPPSVFLDWLTAPGRPEPPPGAAIWVGHLVPNAPPMSNTEKEIVTFQSHSLIEWGPTLGMGNLAMILWYGYMGWKWTDRTPTMPLGSISHEPVNRYETAGVFGRLRYRKTDTFKWPPGRPINMPEFLLAHNIVRVGHFIEPIPYHPPGEESESTTSLFPPLLQ